MPTLDWIGKRAVLNHHREVPFHLLTHNAELSAGDPDAGNLVVQGDNLLALKALLPYYAQQVKLIDIDPPYNTGNEGWVYNDAKRVALLTARSDLPPGSARRTGPVIELVRAHWGDSASQGANKMQLRHPRLGAPSLAGFFMKTKKAKRAVFTVTLNVEKLVLYLLIGLSALRCH